MAHRKMSTTRFASAGGSRSRFTASLKAGKSLNVLFTCIGRRVSLLNSFRQAAKTLGIKACFMGTDVTELAPALQLCDKRFLVRPISSTGYTKDLLRIVKTCKVRLLIPTIDTDLLVLAENKPKFAKIGCHVLVSDPKVVKICQDKRKTAKFLKKNSFGAPWTIAARTALAKNRLDWPLIAKPSDGAAGKEVTIVKNRQELMFFSKRIPNCIVQEFIKGTEYTCDVFIDFDMNVRCVVPRKRLEVRAGEVSKAQVVKNHQIMNTAAMVAKKLEAGPGVITSQAFLTAQREMVFTDINPRFGGGVPLAIKAGADFPKWILQQLIGRKPTIEFDGFKDRLTMLRYDHEVWLE